MTHYFKVIVSGEQFSASKPNPEIFLRAAEALGTVPGRTLVLEDSYNGVRAGANGRFITVMVPDMAPANDEMRRLYTAECRDLYEVLDGLAEGEILSEGCSLLTPKENQKSACSVGKVSACLQRAGTLRWARGREGCSDSPLPTSGLHPPRNGSRAARP